MGSSHNCSRSHSSLEVEAGFKGREAGSGARGLREGLQCPLETFSGVWCGPGGACPPAHRTPKSMPAFPRLAPGGRPPEQPLCQDRGPRLLSPADRCRQAWQTPQGWATQGSKCLECFYHVWTFVADVYWAVTLSDVSRNHGCSSEKCILTVADSHGPVEPLLHSGVTQHQNPAGARGMSAVGFWSVTKDSVKG